MIAAMTKELVASIEDANEWWLLLEYEIPRRERRPDAIILAWDLIFVVEFKIGQTAFGSTDRWQAQSYALDIRDFHAASRDRFVTPILVASKARITNDDIFLTQDTSTPVVLPVETASELNLAHKILLIYQAFTSPTSRELIRKDGRIPITAHPYNY